MIQDVDGLILAIEQAADAERWSLRSAGLADAIDIIRRHDQEPTEAERRCETCGSNLIHLRGCTRCGAPQCCDMCCQVTTLQAMLDAKRPVLPLAEPTEEPLIADLRALAAKWERAANGMRCVFDEAKESRDLIAKHTKEKPC